ncbi:MAG: hypothetical protein ABIB93_00745 [Chloroflexota bacterium]
MKEMYFLWILTGIALLGSLAASRQKTVQALKLAVKRLGAILPQFITILFLVSVVLYLVSDELITTYLVNENRFLAVLFATMLGSVTILPGFIAFPLAGILLASGVPYMVISAFTTTLMMVGVLTYPVERAYFGAKVTIIRNITSFLIALAVAFMTGVFFGEIF